ncbi:MAG: hypothetical protein UIH32_03395 [Streptococcus mutans]|nr:hypothetical protein [Streptococcus mutans]
MTGLVNVFDDNQAQQIVDTILRGYKNYIDERLEKKASMKVSAAYAWVKANHIDDVFAKSELDFVKDFHLEHAGQSWDYLEFNTNVEKYGKVMIILKGLARLNQVFPKVSKAKSGYLYERAKINTAFLGQHVKLENGSRRTFPTQMELFSEEEITAISSKFPEYNNFLIITYQANEFNLLTDIKVVMPDARHHILQEVQNLSEFIAKSEIRFDEEKYQHIEDLSGITEVGEFDIAPNIASQEEKQ